MLEPIIFCSFKMTMKMYTRPQPRVRRNKGTRWKSQSMFDEISVLRRPLIAFAALL